METTPGGRRLADSATGAILPLSEGELRLVELWGGRGTAVELAARAFTSGVYFEAAQVAAFFLRLSRIGVLDQTPPAVPDAPVVQPAVKQPGDVVPAFRGDLTLESAPGTRGVIQVTDPLSVRTFTLYDFEVSVARMLNGRRTAGEVLEAADRIGVPMTMAALRAFIDQLETLRFIDTAHKRTHVSTWKPRRPWSDEVRDLYQQALKLARRGDRHDALSCLESLLELDPRNEEALALNVRLSDVAGRPAIGTSFDLLHAKAPPEVVGPAVKPDYPLAQGEDPFEALDPVANHGPQPAAPVVEGPALWPAPALTDTGAEEDLSTSQQQEVLARKRPFWPLVLLAVGLATSLGALFLPVASVSESACTVELIELVTVRAPVEGRVAYDVQSGQLVSRGQVVAHVVTKGGNRDAAALEAKLVEARRRKASLAPAPAAKVAKLQKRVAKEVEQLEAAKKQRARLPKGTPAKKLAAADRGVKAREAALGKSRAALEALTHGQALAAAESTIAQLQQELEGTRKETASPDLVATEVGRWVVEPRPLGSLTTDTSDVVEKGAIVGRVVSTSLKVTPTQAEVPPTGKYVVTVGGDRLEARSDSSKLYIDGEVGLAGRTCTVTVPEGSRPWVLTLLR